MADTITAASANVTSIVTVMINALIASSVYSPTTSPSIAFSSVAPTYTTVSAAPTYHSDWFAPFLAAAAYHSPPGPNFFHWLTIRTTPASSFVDHESMTIQELDTSATTLAAAAASSTSTESTITMPIIVTVTEFDNPAGVKTSTASHADMNKFAAEVSTRKGTCTGNTTTTSSAAAETSARPTPTAPPVAGIQMLIDALLNPKPTPELKADDAYDEPTPWIAIAGLGLVMALTLVPGLVIAAKLGLRRDGTLLGRVEEGWLLKGFEEGGEKVEGGMGRGAGKEE